MMMREQQWERSNCRHFRIDVCLHQRIYMRAFVNARNNGLKRLCRTLSDNILSVETLQLSLIYVLNIRYYKNQCLVKF